MWEKINYPGIKPEFKSMRRNREWLASRLLMDSMQLPPVSYLPNGKPIIPSGHFSISHCDDLVALAMAEHNVGIDIQVPTEQIRTIHSKFCSPAEQARFSRSPLREMTIIWSAKEAIFKFWGENVAFAKDIEVAPFDCDDTQICAEYKGHHGVRRFNLMHFRKDSHEIIVAL